MMSARRALLPVAFLLAGSMLPVQAQDAPPQPPSPKPLNQNVRVDVTVTLKGEGKPLVKTLSMVTSDDRLAKGRAGIEIPVPSAPIVAAAGSGSPPMPSGYNYRSVGLSVDATPRIIDASRVMLRLNWQFSTVYKADGTAAGQPPSFGTGQSDVGAVFESAKPIIVAQAVDGETGREYTVQVTATILK